jgi:DNA-directed RNA polymerase subunit K/omega
MSDYKKSKAPSNTVTRDLNELSEKTGNIYKTIAVIGKRANQIQKEMKEELDKKLDEFAYYADNYEEVFENREQIEISKYYERLPKPGNIAMEEYLDDEIYVRDPNDDQ